VGAFREYSKLFKAGISVAARELGYSQSNICILEGSIEKLQREFPDVYENLVSCIHNMDKRPPLDYGRDLVASWIFEDVLISRLKAAGLNIVHSGADSKREILKNIKVSASSDSNIEFSGKTRPMEIMSDYTGWWSRKGWFDLRDAKYNNLVSSKSLFLGVSTTDIKCFLMDFALPQTVVYKAAHKPYGGKPAYSVKVPSMIKFDVGLLVKEIQRIF
jgi:hypothetical protein